MWAGGTFIFLLEHFFSIVWNIRNQTDFGKKKTYQHINNVSPHKRYQTRWLVIFFSNRKTVYHHHIKKENLVHDAQWLTIRHRAQQNSLLHDGGHDGGQAVAAVS